MEDERARPDEVAEDLIERLKRTGLYQTTTAVVRSSMPSRDSRKSRKRRESLGNLGVTQCNLEIASAQKEDFKAMAEASRAGKTIDEIVADQLSPDILRLPPGCRSEQGIDRTGYEKLTVVCEELSRLHDEEVRRLDAQRRRESAKLAREIESRTKITSASARIKKRIPARAVIGFWSAAVFVGALWGAQVYSEGRNREDAIKSTVSSLPPPQPLSTERYQQVFKDHQAAYKAFLASPSPQTHNSAYLAYEIHAAAYLANLEYAQAITARNAQGNSPDHSKTADDASRPR